MSEEEKASLVRLSAQAGRDAAVRVVSGVACLLFAYALFVAGARALRSPEASQ